MGEDHHIPPKLIKLLVGFLQNFFLILSTAVSIQVLFLAEEMVVQVYMFPQITDLYGGPLVP